MEKVVKDNSLNSPKGMASVKLEDFKALYEWQLEGYGHQRKNTIVGMSLQEYFNLGVFCINNKISIAGFMKAACKERKHLVEQGLIDINEDNTTLLEHSIQTKKLNEKEGKLF